MTEQDGNAEARRIASWICQADRFAQSLGIELADAGPGHCELTMTVRDDMLNGVGLTHGGVTFSLADVAFAVASNSRGRIAVALNATISFPAASRVGERLRAVARERSLGRQTATYEVEVTRADGALIGLFTGTVFRRSDPVEDWIETRAGDSDGA